MSAVEIIEKPNAVNNDIYGKKVILFDDNENSMDHVMNSLIEVCKIDQEKAFKIMLEAHNEGKAIAYTGSDEACETIAEGLSNQELTVEIQ